MSFTDPNAGGVVLSLDHNPNHNLNPPTLADSTRRRLPAHAGANASNIQALLPILALDAVARGLHSWRSREKRCRAEYRSQEPILKKCLRSKQDYD